MYKISKFKINKYLFIDLIIVFLSFIISRIYTIDELAINFKKNLLILGWLNNLLFIWGIYSIYKIKKDILDFNIVFLIFMFLFCNGQTFLYTIGVPIKQLSVFRMSSNEEIIKAVIYFYFSLLFFKIGLMLCIKRKYNFNEKIEDKHFISAIKIYALITFLVSIVPYIYLIVPKIKMSILYGYSSLYQNAEIASGLIIYTSKLFIPSILLFLYAYRENKVVFNIEIIFLLVLAIANLLIGARGDALSIIIILIIFHNIFVKKIEGKNILKLGMIVLVIMLIIPTIASFRSVKNKTTGGLIETMKNTLIDNESNFIVKTISELGYTMHSFILTDKVVPNIVNYKYGESYLASILMLIPSQLMGGYSFASKAALDTWLQNIHNMSYGPGFSLVSETYYNFGYYGGIIFTAVMGYIFSRMFNLYSKDKNKNELLKLLSMIFLYNSLIVVRFPFHNTTRNMVYMYLVPYLGICIIYNTIKKKRGK